VVENLDDARMAQLREEARLDLEPRGVAEVEQALDRDLDVALAVGPAIS
jgi:hypothetical protein